MPAYIRLFPLALLPLLLVGCGGGGAGGVNSFQGSYSGTYVSTADATVTGTVTLNITSRGIVTGTLGSDSLRGQIVRDGGLNAALLPISDRVTLSGTLQKTTVDGLTGTVTETQGSTTTTLSLTLAHS